MPDLTSLVLLLTLGTPAPEPAARRAVLDENGTVLVEPGKADPFADRFPEASGAASPFSSEGLPQEPLRNGGALIRLQGRFRYPLRALQDASGKIQTRHHELPGDDEPR